MVVCTAVCPGRIDRPYDEEKAEQQQPQIFHLLHFTYTLKAHTQCVVYIGYAAVSTAENTKMKRGESMEFRHEVKHEINNFDLLTLRRRLQTVAYPDPHAVDGKYLIRSLYFDDLSDRALREKINGAARREKFRIRYYNGDTSVIRLEKKTKINDLGSKQSAPLTAEQAQATVDGDIGWMADSGYPLIRELYSKMRTRGLSPKTIADYTREPFIYPAGNVRVTLDYDIRSGMRCTDFLNKDCVTVPVSESIILEVKWDGFLPDIIKDAISMTDIRAGAFSKYAACRIYG